jgi:ubiquinone/menaquinone biosynthesis C-methylase UbiE
MDTQKFYEEDRRLSYNPAEVYGSQIKSGMTRVGWKKLFAFDDRFVTVSKKLANLIRNTKVSGRVKLLDIAMGDGVYERMLPKELLDRCDIYAIDISKTQLNRIKDIITEGKIVDLNSEKLPYKDNTFDIVIVSELLEHVFYPDKVLSEAVRVLKKDGRFLLTYPNSGALQLRLSLFFTGSSPLLNYPGNKEHIRYFKKRDIVEMIEEKASLIEYSGLGSLLFAKWNFPIRFPVFRIKQIFWNRFLPNMALGNMMVFKK